MLGVIRFEGLGVVANEEATTAGSRDLPKMEIVIGGMTLAPVLLAFFSWMTSFPLPGSGHSLMVVFPSGR